MAESTKHPGRKTPMRKEDEGGNRSFYLAARQDSLAKAVIDLGDHGVATGQAISMLRPKGIK